MDEDHEDIYVQYFTRWECTCDHDEEEHGWVRCEVEGCACEAHFEE